MLTPMLEIVFRSLFAVVPRLFRDSNPHPDVDFHVLASLLAINIEAEVFVGSRSRGETGIHLSRSAVLDAPNVVVSDSRVGSISDAKVGIFHRTLHQDFDLLVPR